MRKILPFLFLILSFQGFAQSGNYWTQQYGTRSMLLSGSVVGGVEDLGAVYYNPARLGLIENPAFLISANVYQLTNISFENLAGDNVKVKRSKFSGVPSLAAGTFKLGFLPNHNFAYAVLSRQNGNLDVNYVEENSGEVIESWPGQETFEGQVKLHTKTREDWFGLSWSHAVKPHFSVGGSWFLVVNSDNKGSELNLRALDSGNNVAIFDFHRTFDYSTVGFIWKFGAAWTYEKIDLGLTLTTPLVNFIGSSNYNYQLYFSGIEGVTVSDDIYGNSYQSGLDIETKRPLSIGAGATFKFPKSKLHVSAEYYNGLDKYTVFQAEEHALLSQPDSVINFRLIDQKNSVINAGVGYEWTIGEKVSGYVSASTDFSAVVDNFDSFLSNEEEITNTTVQADFYHFGLGVVLDLKGADITLGATRTSTTQDIPRPVSFPDEGEDVDDIFDPTKQGTMKLSRWQFVFSLSVPFLKDYLKKNSGKSGNSGIP